MSRECTAIWECTLYFDKSDKLLDTEIFEEVRYV